MKVEDSDGLLQAAQALSKQEQLDLPTSLMRVFLLRLASIDLPPEVLDARAIAHDVWFCAADPARLAEAKDLVWRFLRTFPPGEDLKSDEGRRARALLCVLEPRGNEQLTFDLAEWFGEMAKGQTSHGA